MDAQQADRMRALWKSGRDKYMSFFTCLEEVRREVGDDALPNWCFDNLQIGISVISETAKVLRGIDAEREKANLAVAKEAEKRQRKGRRHADAAIEIAGLRHRLEEALRAARSGITERRCEHCNQPFAAQSPAARYCSGKCRVAAHRARASGSARQPEKN